MITPSGNPDDAATSPDVEKALEGFKPNGQFAKGNKLGKGNPFARQLNQFRAAIYASATAADVDAVIKVLLREAKGGNVAAAREFLDRLVGKSIDSTPQAGNNMVVNLLQANERDRILLSDPRARKIAGDWQALLDEKKVTGEEDVPPHDH